MSGMRITVSPPNGRYNFVEEWMSYAEEEGRNLFFQFFCYFLAFNHLYESKDLWNRNERVRLRSKEHISDLDKIIAFLMYAIVDAEGPRLNVAVEDSDYETLCSVKWHSTRSGRWMADNPREWQSIEDRIKEKDSRQRKTVLALTKVYRVRCNLFHGEKHVADDRDRKLVECSNNLLSAFLRECANHGLGIEYIHFSGNEE